MLKSHKPKVNERKKIRQVVNLYPEREKFKTQKNLMEVNKMPEKEFEPKAPDYRGGSYAIWKDKDKNGNTILKLKHDGWKQSVVLFKNEPKEKKEEI
jgi:hypothetical protein